MKKSKKLISLFISLVLIVTAFPLSAFAKTSAPAKPSSLSASSTVNSITLKWKKVSKAGGYTVYQYNSKSRKYTKLKNVTKNTYKITKLSSATTYTYAVKAYKKEKKKTLYSSYSSKLTVSTLPDKVSSLKVLGRSKSSVYLSWAKVKNATSYRIDYSTDKTFKKGVKSKNASSLKTTVSSLSNKAYYFRIFAIKTLNKKKYTSSSSKVIISKAIDENRISSVNATKTYQTIEGFGASAAWWAHKVGGWDNAEDIIKYLYDKKDGIGLNIYRYNIGTGSRDDEKIPNYWQRTDGFIKSVDFDNGTITYDFTRDAEAQNSMRIAKKLAGNDLKVCLFSNSPPVQLTKNGKAYCSFNEDDWYWGWQSNLEEENYSLYAKFECDVADYFVKEGYNVFDVSPVNEPQFQWACNKEGYMGQEGAHYKPWELKGLYHEMAVKAFGKPYKISMFEGGAAEGIQDNGDSTYFVDYINEIFSDSLNKRYYKNISCHSYWADAHGKQQCRAFVDSIDSTLSVSSTEYCQMYNDGNNGVVDIFPTLQGEELNGYTIEFGVQMARVINEDLTILNSTQWNWWTACSNGIYPDGLVYINDNNHSDIKTTKRLWCLGNYSRFISEGAKRVEINEAQKDILSSAFVNPDGSLVAVYVNQTDKTTSVNINAENYSRYKVYETSEKNNLKLMKNGAYYLSESVSLPAQSVVSVILTN